MRRTLLAVTVLLSVVVAGTATGAGPAPTSDASGPLPYAVYQTGRNAQLQMFVAPNGRRVRFAAISYRATCVRAGRTTRRRQSDDLGGIVIENGRRFIRRERFDAGGQRGRRVLSGRFARTWTVASVRYETRFTARDHARCHAALRFRPRRLDSTAPAVLTTPSVPPPATVQPAPAPAPSPSPSPSPTPAPTPAPADSPGAAGSYSGTTAAGDPISFTLGATGDPVTAIGAAITLACDDEVARRAALAVDVAESGRVRANGRFDAAGSSGDLRYELDGAASGGSASGRLTIELDSSSSGPGSGEDCSGGVTFSAVRN